MSTEKQRAHWYGKMQDANRRERERQKAFWETQRSLIVEQYVNGDLVQRDLADIFHVQQSKIPAILKMLDIPAKSRIRYGSAHWMWRGGHERRPYRTLIVKDICNHCGTTDKLVIHHKDFDHQNNILENLQILCNPCHLSLHKTAWWQGQRSINAPNGWVRG